MKLRTKNNWKAIAIKRLISFNTNTVSRMIHHEKYHAVMANILLYDDLKYLEDDTYCWVGLTIHGMPWSPPFHSDRWVFNADEAQMLVHLSKEPSNVDILLTHGPAFGFMDLIPAQYGQPNEDLHNGCKKTIEVMRKRLKNLKLFAFGHIHQSVQVNSMGCDNYGIRMVRITNTKNAIFSNGACLDNNYKIVNPKPISINL